MVRWYGFTPTCMGNTPETYPRRQYSPVHPHMHGEYVPNAQDNDPDGGSPPHAWGIREVYGGIANVSVHPHMYGEYIQGKLSLHGVSRFTPTCMGNTKEPPDFLKLVSCLQFLDYCSDFW